MGSRTSNSTFTSNTRSKTTLSLAPSSNLTRSSIDPSKLLFTAADSHSVDEFHAAALLAGGSSKVRPTEGHDESLYYKAVVLDFDGNQIGAMYRYNAPQAPSRQCSDAQRITRWQSDVLSNSERSSNRQPSLPKVVVNNITTTPAVEVHRTKPDTEAEAEISTKAIIGTILGAGAGAAVAYAMAKSEKEKPQGTDQRHPSYRAIEAPHRITEVIYEPAESMRSGPIQMIDHEAGDSSSRYGKANSRVKTIMSSKHCVEANLTKGDYASSTGRTAARSNGTRILTQGSDQISAPSRQSHASTVKKVASNRPETCSQSFSEKSAKDIALPPSRVSTKLTSLRDRSEEQDVIQDLATVVPDDSISQVSTKRSSNHHHTSDRRHHRHHSKSGHTSKHSRKGSHGSSRTVRA